MLGTYIEITNSMTATALYNSLPQQLAIQQFYKSNKNTNNNK